MIIVAAIHGILTKRTAASWPEKFEAWMAKVDPRVRVLTELYEAGPFPRWNHWFVNPKLAEDLSRRIQLFTSPKNPEDDSIWLVAHSNGAVIALETMKRLQDAGVPVTGLFLTGAACESDIEKNGVWRGVFLGRKLRRAVSWSSGWDGVVNCNGFMKWLKWPYGDLGCKGWTLDGQAYRTSRIYTLWATGGHTAYFEPTRIEGTFRRIYKEIRQVEEERCMV